MRFSLVPDAVFQDFAQITPAELRRQGIHLLLSDLDYTLAPKHVRQPDERVCTWIESLRVAGISFMIVSNNRSCERVDEFCANLGVPYQGHAGKPGIKGLNAAMKQAGETPDTTAMVGDKLLTDILAANRAGVKALMVEPLGGAITPWQKVLHFLQAPFKLICFRRNRQNQR